MIKINKAILHILDFNSGITVFSEQELEIENNIIYNFLSKHIEKCSRELSAKNSKLSIENTLTQKIRDYKEDKIKFKQLSLVIGEAIYSNVSHSDKIDSTDLLICDFTYEDKNYIAILLCKNRIGFTHQVTKINNTVKNDIINHYAILPNLSQKLDEFAFINLTSFEIMYFNKKRYIDGKDSYVFQDLFDCTDSISPKEAIKSVNTIALNVAENHGANTAVAISKVKSYISDNSEISDNIDTANLAMEVFHNSEDMQKEFISEIRKAGIPSTIKVDKNYAIKTNKTHKIKTDTGIEITIPVDYYQNKDFIEFINNPDGSLSIELRNIGQIINK